MDEQDKWEAQLKADGLGLRRIESWEMGGQAVYPLDELDGYSPDLIHHDQYDSPIAVSHRLKRAMVDCIPKIVKELVAKREQEGLSRSEAQTLRRYLQFLGYDKIKAKATAIVNGTAVKLTVGKFTKDITPSG